MTGAMLCLLLANGFMAGLFGAISFSKWIALSDWLDARSYRISVLCSMFNSAAAVLGLVLLWP